MYEDDNPDAVATDNPSPTTPSNECWAVIRHDTAENLEAPCEVCQFDEM